jgi:hypothetical protein
VKRRCWCWNKEIFYCESGFWRFLFVDFLCRWLTSRREQSRQFQQQWHGCVGGLDRCSVKMTSWISIADNESTQRDPPTFCVKLNALLCYTLNLYIEIDKILAYCVRRTISEIKNPENGSDNVPSWMVNMLQDFNYCVNWRWPDAVIPVGYVHCAELAATSEISIHHAAQTGSISCMAQLWVCDTMSCSLTWRKIDIDGGATPQHNTTLNPRVLINNRTIWPHIVNTIATM